VREAGGGAEGRPSDGEATAELGSVGLHRQAGRQAGRLSVGERERGGGWLNEGKERVRKANTRVCSKAGKGKGAMPSTALQPAVGGGYTNVGRNRPGPGRAGSRLGVAGEANRGTREWGAW
jgi:hypothetical protein